jgi:hypothetical protein
MPNATHGSLLSFPDFAVPLFSSCQGSKQTESITCTEHIQTVHCSPRPEGPTYLPYHSKSSHRRVPTWQLPSQEAARGTLVQYAPSILVALH